MKPSPHKLPTKKPALPQLPKPRWRSRYFLTHPLHGSMYEVTITTRRQKDAKAWVRLAGMTEHQLMACIEEGIRNATASWPGAVAASVMGALNLPTK